MEKHTINGQVDQYGILRMNMNDLREFCKKFPNQKIIVTLEVLDGGDVEIMKSWYRNHALPRIVKAWRSLGENLTEEQADIEMIKLTTVRKKTAGDGDWYWNLDEMDRDSLKKYLDEINYICSNHLNLVL